MFGDWDNFYDDDETLDLLRRYKDMVQQKSNEFFDLYEFECIIDYFSEQYNFKDALNVVCYAIRQHPNATSMKLKYAQLLIENLRPGRALGILKTIREAESGNHEFYLAMGFAFNLTGRYAEAQSAFKSALNLSEDLRDEVAYSIAQSYMQLNMYAIALKYLVLAYHYNKGNILVLYDLGLSYEKIDDPVKSEMYYHKYLDIDPFAEHVWNNLGMLYSRTDDFEKAEESYDYAIAVNPQFLPAYFCKANMFMAHNRFREAIEIYNDLLIEDGSNTQALYNKGNCHLQLGEFSQALKVFKFTLEIADDYADAWYGACMVYFGQRRYTLSLHMLKKALNIEPDNADYWFMLGEIFSRTRKLNKAIDAYTRASELNPDDPEAKMACAQILFKKRRIEEAIRILIRLYKYLPDNSSINYRLAAYYAYQQNLCEAQQYFKKGLTLNFQEHTEMFRHFPKTKSLPLFRHLIESNLYQPESLMKSSK